MSEGLTTLYGAIGAADFALLLRSGFREFPPRLEEHAIFFDESSKPRALAAAHEWNARDAASGYVGYVTCFRVRSAFLVAYPPRVRGQGHTEYWIPTAHLPRLNREIVGTIEVIAEFRGTPKDS
jgi:hypothetical protein